MLVAVDTNFLLGLAWENAKDALHTLKSRAPHLIVSATPTVLEEVRFFQKQSLDDDLKQAAATCLASLKRVWQFNPAVLSASQDAHAERVGGHILRTGIL